LFATFLLDQILNYGKAKLRFSEITIRNCIVWRISSPKGYEFCRAHLLKLPSRLTLHRYSRIGKNVTSLIKCRLEAEAKSLQPIERVCSLVIDDMAIKEKLQYNRAQDRLHGLETTTKKTIGRRPVLANQTLCYVIHGLSTKFTIPAAYFFHRTLKTPDFYQLTLDVLKPLHDCGFLVIRIVTDNHEANVGLFKAFANSELCTRIEHPVTPNIPLFFSFDYCHAIKNARNIFLNHDMQAAEGVISSAHLKDLYRLQRNLTINPVRFLTKKHLNPGNFEKMNVRRAVQLFLPPVTAALEYLRKYSTSQDDFSTSKATSTYMEMMYIYVFSIA
jgi:hypothetical protein